MHWERLDHDCHNENAFRRLRVLAAGADNLRVPFLQGGKNGQGPNLWGLIGRSSGSVDGFAYSAANKNSGITWSAKHLEVYLQDPKKVTPRPRRAFVVLRLSFMWVPWDARGFHGRQGQQQALLRGSCSLFASKMSPCAVRALSSRKVRACAFLTGSPASTQYMPGTKMVFAGLKKEDDRANLIAYLKSRA